MYSKTCQNPAEADEKHPRVLFLLQMLADIRPNEEHMRNFVVRNPMSSAVQVGPTMSEHEVSPCCQSVHPYQGVGISIHPDHQNSTSGPPLQVNTNAVVLVNKAMCHLEGGWPKEVDCTEVEQVIRYRRKARLPVTFFDQQHLDLLQGWAPIEEHASFQLRADRCGWQGQT